MYLEGTNVVLLPPPPPFDLNYGSIKKYLNIQWSVIIASLQSMNADVRLTELLKYGSAI